jgi:hypothetical protein
LYPNLKSLESQGNYMQTTEKTDYFQDLTKYKAELAEIDSHFIILSQKRDNLMKLCESLESLANVTVQLTDQIVILDSETNQNKAETLEKSEQENLENLNVINESVGFSIAEKSQTESLSVKGMPSSKASAAFLRFIKKKQKTKELAEGIRKYGFESNTSHPINTLRTTLRPHIHPKGELTYDTETKLWGLAEWETDLSDDLKTTN